MARPRTADEIRRDLEAEREQLSTSVEDLRAAIADATDVKGKLAAKLPVVAAAAVGAGFFLGGGIGATMRLLARKSREGSTEAKVGRFRIVDRG
jgi:predicted ATPase with chaperone activity